MLTTTYNLVFKRKDPPARLECHQQTGMVYPHPQVLDDILGSAYSQVEE